MAEEASKIPVWSVLPNSRGGFTLGFTDQGVAQFCIDGFETRQDALAWLSAFIERQIDRSDERKRQMLATLPSQGKAS